MNKRGAAIVAGIFLSVSAAAHADEGWHWELAADVAFPTGKFGPSRLKNGFGVDAVIAYGFTPQFASYFGWNWHTFRTDSALTGARVDLNESGFVLGLQWRDRLPQTRLDYRIRGGILINQFELEDGKKTSIAESGYGFGWELGAAVLLPIGGKWTLTPGVKLRSLSRDLRLQGQTQSLALRYLTLGAGVSLQF